jgi:hypothetical protein
VDHGRRRRDRRSGKRTLAGNGTAAGDSTRLVIVVRDGFGCRRFGGLRGCRLDDSRGLRLGLGRCDRLGDHRLDRCRDSLGLRLGLGGGCRSLLGGSLLDGTGRSVCRRLGGSVCWRCRFCGGCLLGRCLLDRLGFLGLLGTSQTITNCATFEPIGLCLDEGARVGLHTHTHGVAQRHHFGVGHSELLGELVHAHVFRQNQFSLSLASAWRSLFRQPLILPCW